MFWSTLSHAQKEMKIIMHTRTTLGINKILNQIQKIIAFMNA